MVLTKCRVLFLLADHSSSQGCSREGNLWDENSITIASQQKKKNLTLVQISVNNFTIRIALLITVFQCLKVVLVAATASVGKLLTHTSLGVEEVARYGSFTKTRISRQYAECCK